MGGVAAFSERLRVEKSSWIRESLTLEDYIDHIGVHVPRVLTVLFCCLVALPVAAEDELWEWVTPLPQGHSLTAAAVGNGVTVAVGGGGTIIASTDRVEWLTRQTGADYQLMDVVWGNGLFVAVGRRYGWEGVDSLGVVVTSEDGADWVERYRNDAHTLEAVAWTGSRFVAVGIGGTVLLSSDGLSWSEWETDGWAVRDLAWNGSMLVAIGSDNVLFGHHAYFTSENGEDWHVQNFECEYCSPESIAAIDGRFVIVGPWRKVLVSDDGETWIEAPYDASQSFDKIVSGGDRLLATGYGIVGTSLDGYAWTVEDVPAATRFDGLAWGVGGYLAVGEAGFMMSSPEGSEWTQLSTELFEHRGGAEIDELAMGGPTIVGVGAGIVRLRRGDEWVWRPSPGDVGPRSVIWTGTAFWAAGENGVVSSVDGIRWSQALVDHELRLYDIVWNGSVFVVVGWNPSIGDGRKLILTSPDGFHWRYQWFEQEDHFFAVGWTGLSFVVAGSGSQYLTSTDGLGWQQHPQSEDLELRDMAWSGDRLVAVGGRWQAGGVILSTDDGIHWVESALPEDDLSYFNDVTWTGTHFVAVSRKSGDVFFTSTDGISWSSETTGTGVWPVSVVGDERNLYITGRGLQIIRRTKPLVDPPSPRRPERRVVSVGGKVRVGPVIQE